MYIKSIMLSVDILTVIIMFSDAQRCYTMLSVMLSFAMLCHNAEYRKAEYNHDRYHYAELCSVVSLY